MIAHRAWDFAASLLCCCAIYIGGVFAQNSEAGNLRSPVLVIDTDVLYRASDFGERIVAEIQTEGDVIAAENREIEAALAAEEQQLTEQRQDMDPTEFRRLADAFDSKVRTTRAQQVTKARALTRREDVARGQFLTAAAPILENMMREAGAVVVLDRRSVFISLNAVDITRNAVLRINAEIGDGASLPEPQEDTDAPEATTSPDAVPED